MPFQGERLFFEDSGVLEYVDLSINCYSDNPTSYGTFGIFA